jgi:opacity protein-like surface antigen
MRLGAGPEALGRAITSSLAIAGEVGGSYLPAVDPTANTTSIYSFLAGPRYVIRVHERVTAFGQFLLGGVHSSADASAAGTTTDHFAYQPGGGVDIAIASRWAARLQGDYRALRDTGTASTFNQGRFLAGVVYRP